MAYRDDILNELKEVAPGLTSPAPENPYKVPAGYFEELPAAVMARIKTGPTAAKVVNISFGKRFFRYAAAAIVIGIITLGAWLFIKQSSRVNNGIAQNESAATEVLQKVQNISDSEMADYVEGVTSPSIFDNSSPSAVIKEDDVALMLANVPDEELQQYVEQHNSIKEIIN